MLKRGQRALGRSWKVIVSCPVTRVGADCAGQLDVGGEPVGDEEDPVAVAGKRLAEVDEARQRARQRGAVDLEASDLRELGTVSRERVPKFACGVGAGRLAVGGVGVDREALRQRDGRRRAARVGEGIVGLSGWGTVEVDVDPGCRIGLRRRRLRVEARVEAELVAPGHLRPGVVGMARSPVVGRGHRARTRADRRRSSGSGGTESAGCSSGRVRPR